MAKLTLIVATYNRAEKVLITLSSVASQDADPADWECVVVNNNSTDNTIEEVERFISQNPTLNIRLVTELRQGLSYARNCGIMNSAYPLIAIIDDDEIIVPQFISSYIEFFDHHSDVGAAGGAIVPRYDGVKPTWLSHYTELPIANPLDLGGEPSPFPKGRIPGGGNMAIRRDVIDRYGAFDPQLGRVGSQLIGGEESNLFERLRGGGVQVWWVPSAVMYHLIPDEKLQRSYLNKLWFSIGVSQMRRGLIEGVGRNRVLAMELFKWVATLIMALCYMVTLRLSKGYYLLLMRLYITRGMVSIYNDKLSK